MSVVIAAIGAGALIYAQRASLLADDPLTVGASALLIGSVAMLAVVIGLGIRPAR